MTAPLVSAIMPTRNRPDYAQHALNAFLRQDYPSAELVIIDDDDAPSFDGVYLPGVTYLRCPERLTIGAKRNIACDAASGDLILHWDDDDWHASNRIKRQVAALGDADLSGMPELLYLDLAIPEAWHYQGPDTGELWLAGGSLLYRKSLWARHSFPVQSIGEDVGFVDAHQDAHIVLCPDLHLTVALTHPGNTSPRRRDWGGLWVPYPLDMLQRVMGPDWLCLPHPPPPVAVPYPPASYSSSLAPADSE